MDRVEAQEVGIGFHRAEIVDGHHFDIGAAALDDRPQNVAADTAKSIDGDANCHDVLLEGIKWKDWGRR